MFTIYDYIKYYKNVSFDDVQLNEIDYLLFSCLSYMYVEPFNAEITFDEMLKRILSNELPYDIWLMAPKVKELAELLLNNLRYKNVKVESFIKIINDDCQFAAVTFRTKDKTIVSYEGSDGTVISWKENLRMAYKYPLISQTLALKYLEDSLNENDNNIVLVGHSKGGNLAMSALMEANDALFKRVSHVYNFDGPGFLEEVVKTDKYKRMSKKLTTIIPKGSYIGVLLWSDLRYKTVPTTETGFLIHYPTSWCIFGTFFTKDDISKRSKYIHHVTTHGFMDLDREVIENIIEAIFKDNFNSYDSKMRMNFKQVKKAFGNAKENDIRALGVFKRFLAILTVEPLVSMKNKNNKEKIDKMI